MDESWFSYCDGSSQHVGSIVKLEYHASLNAVIAVTNNNSLKIFDANSGAILQQSVKELDKNRKLLCKYHKTNGSIAITDGETVGYRWHNNGVLLLSTALQGPIKSSTDVIKIELPISEARLLSNYIKESKSQIFSKGSEENDNANSDKNSAIEEFMNNLVNEISNADESELSNHKISGKWTTVKVSLMYETLKTACQILLSPAERQGQNIDMIPSYPLSLGSAYGLPILSAIMHQLVLLFPSDNPGCTDSMIKSPSRRLMYSELARRATFYGWPHACYKYALPHAMAQAGFFHQPASSGDDRAMCFACNVCLVCWEPSDEPWSEHERHSPTCPFVCCEPTANVPLSVTHATQPAQPNPFTARNSGHSVPIEYLDLGERSGILAAASKNGLIAVWDINDLPKLLKVSSIDQSQLLSYLKPYLHFDLEDNKKLAAFTLHNLTVTSLHVLDKTPPTKDLSTCDPQDFLTEKSKMSKDKPSSEQMPEQGPSLIPDKLPALVLGVTVVARSKAVEHPVKEKYGVTGVVKQAPKNGRNVASRNSVIKSILEKKNNVTFTLPGTSSGIDKEVSFEDSAVTSMGNFETEKEDKNKLKEDVDEAAHINGEDRGEEHLFSLLTFIQIGKCEPEKNITAENSSKKQQNLTETSIQMEIEDEYYDAMATNGVSSMSVPTTIQQYKGGISMIDEEYDDVMMKYDKNSPEEGPMWDDQFSSVLPLLSDFVDDTPIQEEPKFPLPANNNTPPSYKALTEEQSMSKDSSRTRQYVVLDHKMNYTNLHKESAEKTKHKTETDKQNPNSKCFQIIRNIISTEDGSRLLVTTDPAKSNTSRSTTTSQENIPLSESEIIPDVVSDDNVMLTSTTQGSIEPAEAETSPDQDEDRGSSGEKKQKLFLPLKDNISTSKNDSELGKLYSFNMEPSNSIYYVSSKKIGDENKDIKCMSTCSLLQLTNLPSDFAGASYEDEDLDSLNGDEEDELKQNKQEEGVRRTSMSMRDDGVIPSNGKPTYAISLTEAGKIAVINVETLTIAFTVHPSNTFSETATLINSPDTAISEETDTNIVPDVVSHGQFEKFTSYVYCASTGRLCVSTNKGKLAFIKIGKHSVLPAKASKKSSLYNSRDDCPGNPAVPNEVMVDSEIQDVVDGSHSINGKISSKALLVNQPLTNKTLKSLLQLTKFEPLRPRFTATAPICWTEIPFDLSLGSANTNPQRATYHPSQQPDQGFQKSMNQPSSQQQPYRRHLLHPIQHYTHDMTYHTRAWRLQPDSTSWNDHLFELVFPRQTNLSHIDFKFVLTGKLEQGTDIQISLLKHPGLTTSKNELMCKEQKKKWRHHVKHVPGDRVKQNLTPEIEDLFSFFKPMLTENVVVTFDEPNLLMNPVLFVAHERKITGSMKEFLLLDGSKHEIIAMIRQSLNVQVGQLIMLIGYTTCLVGSSGIRIIVTALKVMNGHVLVPTSGEDNEVDSSAEVKNEEGKFPAKENANIDELIEFAPPPYESLPDAPPTTDSSTNEDSEDIINKDGSSILFGPVSLSDYVDGTGIGGIVTMASMKLLQDSRHRAVLVHIKDPSQRRKTIGPTTSSDEWTRKGCNCLQEISITVHKILRTEVSHERMQRVSLLQSRSLQMKLYRGLSAKQDNTETDKQEINMKSLPVRIASLKILNWIAAIESVDPNERTNLSSQKKDGGLNKASRNLQEDPTHSSLTSVICFHEIKDENHDDSVGPVAPVYCLSEYLKKCFLESPRDVAILALKLLFQTVLKFDVKSESLVDGNTYHVLTNSVLNCLIKSTEIKVESAFGMHCIFQILSVVILSMKEEMGFKDEIFNSTLKTCQIILCEAASKMNTLTNPLHSVLRSNYGLYGTPFDPECFVIDGAAELPNIKPKTVFTSGANERLGKQQVWERYFSKEELNVHDLIMPRILDTRRSLAVVDLLDGRCLSKIGLVECRPLHFTCVDASEGCSVDFENESSAQWQSTKIHQHANVKPSGPIISSDQSAMRTTLMQKLEEVGYMANDDIWKSGFLEQQETAVERIHRRVQQELATKRHFVSNDKQESSQENTSNQVPVHPVMNFSNLTFNLPRTSFLTISRMHSGARRSVVLDFGSLVEVTDIHIPSCPDLSSLTLDAWSDGSKNGPLNKSQMTHVGMTLDICDHNLVLGNLMPPVICRYIKITVIGRYGTTNAESQLHLGHFYGRPLCLSQRVSANLDPCSSVPSPPKKSMKEQEEDSFRRENRKSEVVDLLEVCHDPAGQAAILRSLNYLRAYQDDVECRYGLACCQLQSFLTCDTAHTNESGTDMRDYFMADYRSSSGFIGHKDKASMDKLMYVYDKCIQLQTQMSRVISAIRYMDSILGLTESAVSPFNEPCNNTAGYDQLQTFCEFMITTMLGVPGVSNCSQFSTITVDPVVDSRDLFSLHACTEIFKNICCLANPRLRMQAACLLLSYCSSYSWWGKFLSNILVDSLGCCASWLDIRELPKEHIFSLLLVLGQRSLVVPQKAENVIASLLKVVESYLSPFNCDLKPDVNDNFLDLITWLFLYVTHLVETVLSHNDNFISDLAATVPPTACNYNTVQVKMRAPTSSSSKDMSNSKLPSKQNNSNSKGSQEGDVSDSKLHDYQEFGKALPPPPSTSSSQNASGSTRESRFKSRWDFLSLSDQDSVARKQSSGSGFLKVINAVKAIRDQLQHHKQELKKLNKLKKELQQTLSKPVNPLEKDEIYAQYETLAKLKDNKEAASKHMRGIMSYRRRIDRKTFRMKLAKIKLEPNKAKTDSTTGNISFIHGFIGVSVETCKAVVRGILKLLLELDFTVPSDLIVLACKLASQLCRWTSCQSIYLSNLKKNSNTVRAESVHPLHLSDLVSPDDLKKILILSVGGTSSKLDGAVGEPKEHPCGAWVNHAMFGLLQDMIECENIALAKCYNELYGDRDVPPVYEKKTNETDDLKIEDLTSSNDDDQVKKDEDSNQGIDILDISEAMELVESKDDEFKKRIALVNTFIKSSVDMLNEVKIHMKANGEYVNEEIENEQTEDEVVSSNSKADEEPSPSGRANWFKSLQKFLATFEDQQSTSNNKNVISNSTASQSKRLVQASSLSGWLNNINDDYLTTAPQNVPMKTTHQGSQVSSSNVSRSRGNSVSGSTRSLLCTQAYDCRPVHGILQHMQLQQKVCATATLKYIAKCVSHPPMSFPQEEQGEKEQSETSTEDMETSSSSLTSFYMIRSCFLDLLRDWSSYSIPLTTLCELLLLIQTTYDETLLFTQLEEDESLTLLSLDGIKVLLPALNGMQESISNLKTWKLVMNLINLSLRTGKKMVSNDKKFLETLLSPEMGFWNFLTQMLSSKMKATNIAGNFHHLVPIFGPSMVTTFDTMLATIKSTIENIQDSNLLRSYRDELLHAVYSLASTGQFEHTSNTPTDAQLILISTLCELMQPPVKTLIMDPDLNLSMSIVLHVSYLTKNYLQWCETAAKGKTEHSLADPRSCMTGIFSSIIRPTASGNRIQESSRDSLLFMLLGLCKFLVLSLYNLSSLEEEPCSAASPAMMETDDKRKDYMDVDMESSEEKFIKPSCWEESICLYRQENLGLKKLSQTLMPVKMDIPESEVWNTMAVFVLQDEQIMTSLFTCLSICNSCAMASMFNGLNISPHNAIINSAMTVGDGVFVLLSTISSLSTDTTLPVQAIMRYLSSNRLNEEGKYVSSKTSVSPTCQLSLPLLWYILSVLESPDNVNLFCQSGGARLIADSLVASSRESIDLSPNKTSQVLHYLSAADNRASALAPRAPVTLQSDVAWPALPSKTVHKISGVVGQGFNYPGVSSATNVGIQSGPSTVALSFNDFDSENKKFNFASVAAIECSDTTALSADTLLKPKVMLRRTRSPSWSYHFPSGKQWVSLTLHFPNAFVLKEVQLTPMLMSLSTTPSCVMLETNRTGSMFSSSYQPVSVPVITCGLNEILIKPPSDEVVTSIRIHLKKPVESTSIGLTRIIVNGVSNFMSYHSGAPDFSHRYSSPLESLNFTGDVGKRSTLNWLRILHHCMTTDDSISSMFHDVIDEVDGLIPTLCALLRLKKSSMFTSTIKAVLIQTGTFDLPHRVTEVLYCLLSGTNSFNLGFLGSAQEAASESSIDILYSLAQKKDKHFGLRIEKMLDWVRLCHLLNGSTGGSKKFVFFASHIHTIACILCSSFTMEEVKKNISLDLVNHCYQWSQSLEPIGGSPMTSRVDSPLKRSIDWLLCSFCLVNRDYFEQILQWMDIKVTESGQPTNVLLTPVKLKTLGIVSQSTGCLQILMSKGILLALSNGIALFCHLVLQIYNVSIELDVSSNETGFTINPDNVIAAVNFFSEICQWRSIQDWLGTNEGRRSWISLIQMLCYILPLANQYGAYSSASRIPRYLLLEIQESTIRLLKSVTNSHFGNQRQFTKALCDILKSQAGISKIGGVQLTGFVRSLLLRVVLEDEQYTIHLMSGTGQKFHKGKSNSCASGGTLPCHPMFGTGHFTRTFKIGISSTILDIRAVATDAPLLVSKLQKQKSLLKKTQQSAESDAAASSSEKKSTTKISSIGALMSSLQKKKMGKIISETTGKEASTASNFMKSVVDAGKTAQMKRTSKVVDPEEVTSSIQQSLDSLSLAPIPVITLTCPDLPYEVLDQNATLLQLLAKHQDLALESNGTFINLKLNLTKYTKPTSDKVPTVKKNPVSMETSPSSSSKNQEFLEAEDPQRKNEDDEQHGFTKTKDSLLDCKPLKTMLEVFASLGGLSLIAQHLPMTTFELLHPDTGTSGIKNSPMAHQVTSAMPFMQPGSHWGAVQPGHWGGMPPSVMPMWMAAEEEDIFGFEEEFIDYDDIEPVYSTFPLNVKKTGPPTSGTKKQPAKCTVVGNNNHPCIPSHTMSALCLFLRVPFFSEEFLKHRKNARCLLRLMLGVLDDGQGDPILKLDLAKSLPMLPFNAIQTLLSRYGPRSTPGQAIRFSMTFDTTSFHLILACISRFTHFEPDQESSAGRLLSSLLPEIEPAPINVAPPSYKRPVQPNKPEDNNNNSQQSEKFYWAKGTGFGTGSTTSDWDVEHAVKKQQQDEKYITVLFEVLANFVCPETSSSEQSESQAANQDPSQENCLILEGSLETIIPELLVASGVLPAIASYLRNDSVLDMARHVPLYRSVLRVIRAFAVCPVLCRLLMDCTATSRQTTVDASNKTSSNSDSVFSLLSKIRKCVDTYASRLKAINVSLNLQGEQGLSYFVSDVQKTETLLKNIAAEIQSKDSEKESSSGISGTSPDARKKSNAKVKLSPDSLEKRYIDEIKQLQFDTFELVVEQDDGKLKFPCGHHYDSYIKEASNVTDAARARRLAQESVTLSNSLPLSHSSTVFVRCDEERLDVMKVLITGPSDTPYANGCFEFDVFFPADYNTSPPYVNLLTTGNHSVRFNPNLYNDGKVCLSILNTWHGRPEEKWNPHTSSFLQILVSIQSLILVSEPYFNEPGYERSRGTLAGKQSSREYDANIRQATVKWAMLEQLKSPSPCFKEVIERHFWLKRTEVINQCNTWLAEMKQQASDRHGRRTIAHNYTALQRHVDQFKDLLMKMKCPQGLEDIEDDQKSDAENNSLNYNVEITVFEEQEESKNLKKNETDA